MHNAPDRFGKWISYTASCEHFAYNVCQVPEPKNMDETLSGPHVMEWKEAAESEYQFLMENDTWDLVELPKVRELMPTLTSSGTTTPTLAGPGMPTLTGSETATPTLAMPSLIGSCRASSKTL